MTCLQWFLDSLQNFLQNFWYSMVDWDGFWILWTWRWFRTLYDCIGNHSRCSELDLVWILVFMSILLNCLKPPGKIITSVLEIHLALIMSSGLFVGVLLNQQSCRLLLRVLLNWLQKQGHTPYMWEDSALTYSIVMQICASMKLTRYSQLLRRCSSQLLLRRGSQLLLRHGSQFEMRRLCWTFSDMDANVASDACLAQTDIEIYAVYFGDWRVYKRPGSFNSQSLDCSSLLVKPASKDQKLSGFLRTHNASRFFQIFSKISLSRWPQNQSKLLLHQAPPLGLPPWVAPLLLRKPPFLVS